MKDQSRRLVQLNEALGQHHPGLSRAVLNPQHVSALYVCKALRLNLYPALTACYKWQLTPPLHHWVRAIAAKLKQPPFKTSSYASKVWEGGSRQRMSSFWDCRVVSRFSQNCLWPFPVILCWGPSPCTLMNYNRNSFLEVIAAVTLPVVLEHAMISMCPEAHSHPLIVLPISLLKDKKKYGCEL